MGLKTLKGRIKAAVVTAAMIATTLITPSAFQLSSVSAASVSVNHTFIADGVEDGKRQATIPLSGIGNAKTLTLNFTTEYSSDATIAVYGLGVTVDPYWVNIEKEIKTGGKKSFSLSVDIPSQYVGKVNNIGVGVWYPKTNEKFTLTTITTDGSGTVTPPEVDPPYESQNNKSGTYTFKDNKDGTATITSTLSAQIDGEFDYLLTAGHDEESYIDPETGTSTYEEGDPINSHKFPLSEFGIKNLTGVTFESFEYIIESDVDMNRLMYGGGINVVAGSIADTEYAKGKNGYWYNDQGEEDVEEFGDKFQIDDYATGYNAYNAGQYAKIVWDVPKSVQPFVTTAGGDTVGIQFWYGETTSEEGSTEPSTIETVHLTGAACTYTRTATVPYNKTITKSIGKTIKATDDASLNQVKYNLPDLGLGERDILSAVKFSLTSSADLGKFVGGLGISVDLTNPSADEGWYNPGNIVVLNAGKTIDLMWIIPETIRKDVTTQLMEGVAAEDIGNVMCGFWYGENAESITVKSADFYVYQSEEADLKVEPEDFKVEVGETKKLTVNVPGCTMIPSPAGYIKVDDAGNITGVKEGICKLQVTSPEGQTVTIDVEVLPAKVETTTATTVTTKTTTKTTTVTTKVTTQDPDDIIDWSKVLYGDVDLDGSVDVNDVVTLNMYLLDKTTTPLNATARENADCEYDHNVDLADSAKLINYLAEMIPNTDLGDPDFYLK